MFSFWQKLSERKQDFVLASSLSAFVIFAFYKVVFLAEPISRLFLLAKRDVLFRKYFTLGSSGYDESLYLLQIPYYYLVANYWRNFELPLWNPYSGWGAPFLGDVQASVFSPVRFLFALNPTEYFYNLILVFQIVIAIVGCYLLSREFQLPRYAAVYSALAFAFCPYLLYFVELVTGTTYVFFPLVFWIFVRLAKKPSLARAVVAAITCAIFIATGHPEVSFIGVAFATLLNLLISGFTPCETPKPKKIVDALKWIALVAVLAFCLSAPIILPFVEFFLNSDCYKFAVSARGTNVTSSTIPWQGLTLNLVQACYWGLSPYLGALFLPLLGLSVYKIDGRPYYLSLTVTALVAFLFTCRPGFFDSIFAHTPLSLIPGTYSLIVVLLLLVLLSAFGFAYFVEAFHIGKNKPTYCFVLAILIACFLPPILKMCGFNFAVGSFDNGQTVMAFAPRVWFLTIGISVGLLLCAFLKKKVAKLVIISFVLLATFISEWQCGKLSVPIQPAFKYDAVEPLSFLREQKERVLALGFDVLSPNTNLVFQIPSIGVHNVMTPTRYKKFILAAGARGTTFNTLVDRVPLAKALDYSGIKYVLSLEPIVGRGDQQFPTEKIALPRALKFESTPEIKLESVEIGYDATTAQTCGAIKFDVEKESRKRFVFSIVILDALKKTLWFGGLKSCCPTGKGVVDFDVPVDASGLVPANLKDGDRFTLGIQVFDSKEMKFIKLEKNGMLQHSDQIICLKDYRFASVNSPRPEGVPHYKFISESGNQHVRLYENTRTLGRAYLMFDSTTAASSDEALAQVMSQSFDGLRTVILERAQGWQAFLDLKNSLPGRSVKLSVNRPNLVEMNIDAPADAILVLTDTFFPGWIARIDGQDAEILHANYLFRAVAVKKGIHHVAFIYQPNSVLIALVLWVLGALAAVVLLFKNRVRK